MPVIGKLGKKPPRRDPRTLMLGKYISALPLAPPEADWLSGVTDWGQMANDVLGDCTCAGIGHAFQVWSAATGPIDTPTDADVIKLYEDACNYNPADPNSDQGGVELDVLNYVRQNTFAGRKLVAYVDPAPGSVEHIKLSIALFGGVYIGLALPLSAQTQDVWDDTGDVPGLWGGHAVFVPAYDKDGLTCITWGAPKKMTWSFWQSYCDESHTLLSETWLDRAPADFNIGDLVADLKEVVG